MQNINNNKMVEGVDINSIILEVFQKEFPGASEGKIEGMIKEIGQTIIVESMAKALDEIEIKDLSEDKNLFNRVKSIMEAEGTQDENAVLEISKICIDLDVDLEKIYQEVATDVVKDVLGK